MKIVAEMSDQIGDNVKVTMIDEDGVAEERRISFMDFRAVMNASIHVEDIVHIGELPEGFFDGSKSRTVDSTYRALIEVPAQKRPMMYFEDVYMVPFPTLAFLFKVDAGNLTESYCFAVKDKKISRESRLFRYPYGNVYDSGKICWGNNFLGKILQMKGLDRVIQLFFGSETNDDLWVSCDREIYPTQRVFIEALKDREVFPEEYLFSENNKGTETVGKLLEKHLGEMLI